MAVIVTVAITGGSTGCSSPAAEATDLQVVAPFKGEANIDWVVGGCMSVDCNDRSAPAPSACRAQILRDLRSPVSVDQCASGLGYAYAERRFAVCVEHVA